MQIQQEIIDQFNEKLEEFKVNNNDVQMAAELAAEDLLDHNRIDWDEANELVQRVQKEAIS